jgi:hypothetical protein
MLQRVILQRLRCNTMIVSHLRENLSEWYIHFQSMDSLIKDLNSRKLQVIAMYFLVHRAHVYNEERASYTNPTEHRIKQLEM